MNSSTQITTPLTHRKTTYALVLLLAVCSWLMLSTLVFSKAYAAPYTNSHLIDNALLLDANSMSADNIQSFLSSKSGTLKSSSFYMDCDVAGATAKQMYISIGAPCGQNVSVARIIFYSSQIYGVSPKTVLATMQKEQSLVTNPSPTATAYNQAMGFGCPDSTGCGANSNFFYQIDNGAWALRYHYERANGNNTWWNTKSWSCGSPKNYYKPSLYPRQNVGFYDDGDYKTTPYTTVFIENAATSSLYCYTPHAYNNPQGLYGRAPFGTVGQYYSGSYNFVYYYELWFGNTYAFMHNGVSYSSVFDPTYYLNNNADLRAAFGNDQGAAFNHFVTKGMQEARQASSSFNLTAYRNKNADLRWAFGTSLPSYYWHYAVGGQFEGRSATGDITLNPVSYMGGVDYSSVYSFSAYMANNTDVRNTYIHDDTGALQHFASKGMSEGRVAVSGFNVISYASRYPDLRNAFGNNLRLYYIHYMNTGRGEGRTATGDFFAGTSVLGGVNYSSIYNADYYVRNNPDIKQAFGINDIAILQHFVSTGTNEGRRGSTDFDVQAYKAGNADLRNAFGNNLRPYYMHYMNTGKAEGRSGV